MNYCCTPTLPTDGVGNITNAPLFVDYASGDLRLQPDSPCIDTGNVAYAPGPVDLDGNPRIVNGTVDMGAYEFEGPTGNRPPVLVSQPTSVTNDAGTTVTFSVVADGSEPLGFQWRRDGLPLAGGGNRAGTGTAVLTLTSLLGGDAGGYSVVVSNGLGSVTSAVATLALIDPVIAVQSASQIGQWGQSVTFSVAVVGTAPLAYQWWEDGAALAGGTGPSLTLTNLQAGDAGQYYVVVSNQYGSATSAVEFLTMDLVTLDSGFNPGANDVVSSLALQADGKILVGGDFTTLGGQSRNYIGRLNADGTVDPGFNPGANHIVLSLALQADGEILVGGWFTNLAGQPRHFIGRLNNSAPATQSLTFDGSAITWLRGGASPEVWRTTFDFSTNSANWARLGAGARTAGGWQLTSVSLPSANGALRARGYVAGGQQQASAWFVETDLAVSAPLLILVNDPSFGLSSNRFGFKLSGSAGQVVIVEVSANLASWTPVATNTLGATPLYFSEPYSGAFPQRFYRLRSADP